MNFLAHFYLSGEDNDIRVGNFIGDFVKGSQLSNYSEGIQKGIQLHRQIDSFTDSHEIVLESKVRLRDKFHHYAPVIVDLYYDHFLAKNWSDYSSQDLAAYATTAYQVINGYLEYLPEEVKRTLFYMQMGNWLLNYRTIEGISMALSGLAVKTKFDSKMEMASQSLLEHYDAFEQEFKRFFPLLQTFCNQIIK